MSLSDWVNADQSAEPRKLTRELLDEAVRNVLTYSKTEYRPAPHHPKCAAVASRNLDDCNCGAKYMR